MIAGGHVASLLNRLALFDVLELAAGKPVIAWSAGAMVLTDRIVLFHDYPPYGSDIAQVLDAGFGLAPRHRRAARSAPPRATSTTRARHPAVRAAHGAGDLRRDGPRRAHRCSRTASSSARDGDAADDRRATSSATGTARRAGSRARTCAACTARSRSPRSRPGRARREAVDAFFASAQLPDRRRATRSRSCGAARPRPCTSSTGCSACRRRSSSRASRAPTSGTSRSSCPPDSRVEYKLEVVRNGHGEWIAGSAQPEPRARSVRRQLGRARRPATRSRAGSATTRRRAKGHRDEIWIDSQDVRPPRLRRSTSRRGSSARRRYPLLVVHDGHDYLRYASLEHDPRQPDRSARDRRRDRRVHELARSAARVRRRRAAREVPHRGARRRTSSGCSRSTTQPQSRCLMGASFGAVASLSTACRYPGLLRPPAAAVGLVRVHRHRRPQPPRPAVRSGRRSS